MERICKLAETNRLLTPDDLDEIIDKVARDPEGLAVIEGSDGSCLQFTHCKGRSFHVASLVDAKLYVLPGGTELTATQLRDLLQGYLDGQPMDALTSGWVLLEESRRFSPLVIFCAIAAVILLILYFKELAN